MSDELLPCGHCGSLATPRDYDTEFDVWPVWCNNRDCNASVHSPHGAEDAVARWNRRTPSMPADVRATMREALKSMRVIGTSHMNHYLAEDYRSRIDAALAWLNAQSPTP